MTTLHPPQPGPIVVMAAMRVEMEPTRLRLEKRAHTGKWLRPVLTRCMGIGPQRAVAAFNRIVAEDRPGLVILMGFAGALDPALRLGVSGTAWEVERVIDESGRGYRLGGGVPEAVAPNQANPSRPLLLTVTHLADSPARKAQLWKQWGAAAVDMESFHVVMAAAERQVPLRIVRAISDPADAVVPSCTLNWVRPDGSTRAGKAALDLMLRPRLLPAVLALRRHSVLAAEALAVAVERMILEAEAGLPTSPP